MRLRWVASAVLAAGLGAACGRSTEPSNCGYNGVHIAYTHRADLAAACEALTDTLTYFRTIGFEFEPRFSLTFDRGELESTEGVVSYGQLDPRSSIIFVHSTAHRAPWGLAWNSKLAGSVLRHELVHLAVWEILGPEAGRLPREWHEFIAYAIQLDLMDPALLKEVLARLPDMRAFEALSEVNEITYGMDPDVFAVAAYLMYRERGAENFVRQLMRAEIVPPSFTFPYPELPEQGPNR